MSRKPTTPGEILSEEFLRPMGLTQGARAEVIGVAVRANPKRARTKVDAFGFHSPGGFAVQKILFRLETLSAISRMSSLYKCSNRLIMFLRNRKRNNSC